MYKYDVMYMYVLVVSIQSIDRSSDRLLAAADAALVAHKSLDLAVQH